MTRTYTELSRLQTFEERFEYLKLAGKVGADTFGFDRIWNQKFYTSSEWKHVRDIVIVRDCGCDLGFPGEEIHGGNIVIHHMNPVGLEDIQERRELILDPEFLICTSHRTHNAIHYGDKSLLYPSTPARTPNDTCPWKK